MSTIRNGPTKQHRSKSDKLQTLVDEILDAIEEEVLEETMKLSPRQVRDAIRRRVYDPDLVVKKISGRN